jgi:uncharacterized membrane protein
MKEVVQAWWFRATVGVLTLLSGIALFAIAGFKLHTLASLLIAFLCLMGLERLISGVLGLIVVWVRSRGANRA